MSDQNQSSYEILIKTRADNSGAEAAGKALEANAKAAEHLNDSAKEAIPGLGGVENALKAMGGGPVVAGIAAVAAGIGVAAESVKEFMGAEESFAKLDAALARSGQLTDDYRTKIAELAGELAKTTGIDDDEWIGVITRLTQFGATSGNINAATEAVKNLAGVMDGNLQGASEAISKALQGNYSAFGRLGISVSETGTQAQKLDDLFRQIADRGGGQLEARMQTLSGKTTALWNNVKDITKGIGGWIASTGILQTALEATSNVAGWFAEKLEKIPDKLKGLTNAQNTATASMEAQAAAAAKLRTELDAINKANEIADRRQKAMASNRDQVLQSNKALELAQLEEFAAKNKWTPTQLARGRRDLDVRYLGWETRNKKEDLETERQNLLYRQYGDADRIRNMQAQVKKDREDAKFDKEVAGPRFAERAQIMKKIAAIKEEMSKHTWDDVVLEPGIAGVLTPTMAESAERKAKNETNAKELAYLYDLLKKRPEIAKRPDTGWAGRQKSLTDMETEFQKNTTGNVDPRLFEIKEGLKTTDRVYKNAVETRNSQWRKDTPDPDLNSQMQGEMAQASASAKAQGRVESQRFEYRQYYTAQAAAREAKEGTAAIAEVMQSLLEALRQLKVTAESGNAGVKQIQEQRANGRDR